MKFLLFNIAVVAALIFLVKGENLSLQALKDIGREQLASIRQSDASPPAPAAVEPSVTPPAEPKTIEKQTAAPKPAAAASADQPESTPTPLPPAVAKRRAEVLADRVIRDIDEALAQPNFMSPRERRQSLQNMAEEMELFSAEAVTR